LRVLPHAPHGRVHTAEDAKQIRVQNTRKLGLLAMVIKVHSVNHTDLV